MSRHRDPDDWRLSKCSHRAYNFHCVYHLHVNDLHQMRRIANAGANGSSQDPRRGYDGHVSHSHFWWLRRLMSVSVHTILTTCPVTQTLTVGHQTKHHVTNTVSTIYQTMTSTICTKCVAPPTPALTAPAKIHDVITTVM